VRERAGVTRQVSRPHLEPVGSSAAPSVAEAEPAPAGAATPQDASGRSPEAVSTGAVGRPNRLIALVAALTLAAFAAGFVVGLIVH
jgi:hypothetical protein